MAHLQMVRKQSLQYPQYQFHMISLKFYTSNLKSESCTDQLPKLKDMCMYLLYNTNKDIMNVWYGL